MTVKEYKGESTEELIANKRDKEIAKENPDVILFEPPFITDNSKTGNGNSVASTEVRSSTFYCAKGATIMIQPSNPVYGAKNYPKAIEALKQFATQNNYTYDLGSMAGCFNESNFTIPTRRIWLPKC